MKLQSRDDCLQHHLLSKAGSVPSSEEQHPSFSATHFIRAMQELWLMASAQASHPTDSREIAHVSQSYQKNTICHRLMLSNTLIFLQLLLFKNGEKMYCWWLWVIQQSLAAQRLWSPLWAHWKMGSHVERSGFSTVGLIIPRLIWVGRSFPEWSGPQVALNTKNSIPFASTLLQYFCHGPECTTSTAPTLPEPCCLEKGNGNHIPKTQRPFH